MTEKAARRLPYDIVSDGAGNLGVIPGGYHYEGLLTIKAADDEEAQEMLLSDKDGCATRARAVECVSRKCGFAHAPRLIAEMTDAEVGAYIMACQRISNVKKCYPHATNEEAMAILGHIMPTEERKIWSYVECSSKMIRAVSTPT